MNCPFASVFRDTECFECENVSLQLSGLPGNSLLQYQLFLIVLPPQKTSQPKALSCPFGLMRWFTVFATKGYRTLFNFLHQRNRSVEIRHRSGILVKSVPCRTNSLRTILQAFFYHNCTLTTEHSVRGIFICWDIKHLRDE